MQISKPGAASVAQTPQKLGGAPPANSGPTEQVSVGQSQQDEAIAVIQQMAQARIGLGHKLIGEVIAPAPEIFQEVAQATQEGRGKMAIGLAAAAEGTAEPSPYSVETSEYYILANEANAVAQASLNAEKRAAFQEQAGNTPDRAQLFQQELGFLLEASAYQGMVPPEAMQKILSSQAADGEAILSAGTIVGEMKKHVAPEVVKQVDEGIAQNPAVTVFRTNADLRSRFVSAMKQNQEAAGAIAAGCAGYFNILGQIIQQDLAAQAVLMQLQQNQGQ